MDRLTAAGRYPVWHEYLASPATGFMIRSTPEQYVLSANLPRADSSSRMIPSSSSASALNYRLTILRRRAFW
jgi:hypothetical protein